jgi:hypothetical protein
VSFALGVVVASILVGACGATISVKVNVRSSGAGSVTLTVAVPRATAAQIEDLKMGIPVADLRQAGWSVAGPAASAGGKTVMMATHPFSSLSQVPVLVADIAGSGPIESRPFRLAITERRGLLADRYLASGAVDLRCGVSCFGDRRLAASVGYELGLPPAEVYRLFGPRPAQVLTFRFEIVLPGTVTGANGMRISSGPDSPPVLVWVPKLGESSSIVASSHVLYPVVLEEIAAALGAGALVVLATLSYLLWRHRRRRRFPGRHLGPRRAAGVPSS